MGGENATEPSPIVRALPFPESLCHRCAAPPRYVRTPSSVFIWCPLLEHHYPRQPVRECAMFRPRPPDPGPTAP